MAQTKWYKAKDTFTAEMPGGASLTVAKGSPWPEGHHVVKLDAGRSVLFEPLEDDEPAAAAKDGPPKAPAGKKP